MQHPEEGRTAVVTGGASGIGLATAGRLVSGGARVLITGRDPARLADACRQLGPLATGVVSDTSRVGDVDDLAARAGEDLGGVDLLFVNAGVTLFRSVADSTPDDLDDVLAVNTVGAYLTAQRLSPLVRRGGSIVFTTSVAHSQGLAGSSVYAASKAAVRSMTRSFARELVDAGVRVNAVSPGPVETGILERALPTAAAAAARGQMEDHNPMGRFGTPEEVAAAVLFLAFEASYTTGSELPVDGGVSQL